MHTIIKALHVPAFLCCAFLAVAAPTVHAQERTPVAMTAEQNDLVNAGTKLHDAGDYAKAIENYRRVLAANPDAVPALYEISMSFLGAGLPDSAIVYAQRGLDYASDMYPQFCVTLGTAYDGLGDPKSAVAVYRKGIAHAPDFHMLHFNLGITYARQGDMTAAKASIQRAIQLQPDHPGSHNALATIYASSGERVPALLAAMRFLVLEPFGPRARTAASFVDHLFKQGVTRNDSTHISVSTPMGRGAAGEFSAADLFLGLMGAYELVDTSKKSPEEKMVERYRTLVSVLGVDEQEKEKSGKHGFARTYYVPYFSELMAHDFAEPFAYIQHVADGNPKVDSWLKEHRDRVEAFVKWSEGYQWPDPHAK